MNTDRATNPWRAFVDYGHSREFIAFGDRETHAYLGHVDAWTGSLYWPVRDANDRIVAYVRRELGGLYAPDADQAESMRWAGAILYSIAKAEG